MERVANSRGWYIICAVSNSFLHALPRGQFNSHMDVSPPVACSKFLHNRRSRSKKKKQAGNAGMISLLPGPADHCCSPPCHPGTSDIRRADTSTTALYGVQKLTAHSCSRAPLTTAGREGGKSRAGTDVIQRMIQAVSDRLKRYQEGTSQDELTRERKVAMSLDGPC